tara:strand:+ start:1056 stop:3743 length:2688 start_codon:yes stop_codon:yes gene_type:complete
MHDFIKNVIKEIFADGAEYISDYIIILPNKRSRVFLKKEISRVSKKTIFTPKIYDIEEFMSMISGLEKISETELLFEFYNVYSNNIKDEDKETFDEVISWAKILLKDYNEIDRELCNTDALFDYLKAYKDLTHWSNFEKETELIKNYKEFWRKIKVYHRDLNIRLLEIRKGYQGLIYREAVERIQSYVESISNNKHIFIGFNALSNSESEIIQEIISINGEIYWDIDKEFLNSEYNNSSLFIKSYIKNWSYYKNRNLKILCEDYKNKKRFQSIGTPKNIGQVKYVGEILSSMSSKDIDNTAIVLGDEKLLIPLINSIPQNVSNINVTMGYPLKNSNIFSFFYLLLQIHSKNQTSFYYKYILSILSHELISPILNKGTDICQVIKKENLIYMTKEEIAEIDGVNKTIYKLLFSKWKDANDATNYCLQLIDHIKKYYSKYSEDNFINLELLYAINKIFMQIKILIEKYDYLKNINSLRVIFKELCEISSTPFNGEPFKGLQIMGMLETRLLNYKNIIITSMNEGMLPVGNNNNSFIPFEIKKANSLQTHKEKDAVFAYHFYRLIQRAENIWMIYNTESDAMNNGEISRFITQIEVEGVHNVDKNILISKTPIKYKSENLYIKTKDVQKRLKSLFKNGISASMLCLYSLDKIKFFENYILGVQEKKIEETIASSTLGNIIHDALELLYVDLIGKNLNMKLLVKLKTKINECVEEAALQYVRKRSIQKGKNVIIIETAKNYVSKVIDIDINHINKGNSLKIIDIEKEFKTELVNRNQKYTMRGKIDRVDELNGELRVIDYKSGKKLYKRNLELKEAKDLNDEKSIYNLQLLVYVIGIFKEMKKRDIKTGIISLKNIKDGVLEGIYEGETILNNENIKVYEKEIIRIINEILDVNIVFEN